MNKLIIFPGNSPRNKAWGEGVAGYFGSWFDAMHVQNYDHWDTGAAFIDFDAELEKLRANVAEDGEDTRYVVFAKSIGAILALLAIQRKIIVPQRCTFFGMPLKIVEEQNTFAGDWSPLASLSAPALAFHNEHDPTAEYAFTFATLTEHNPAIEVVTTPGDTHEYMEFALYEAKLKDFLTL